MTEYGASIITSATYCSRIRHAQLILCIVQLQCSIVGALLVDDPYQTTCNFAKINNTVSVIRAHLTCQHAQDPLLEVHDGVVLSFVAVDNPVVVETNNDECAELSTLL